MIRHGANEIFASKDSTVTDEDIISILERGERKVCCNVKSFCHPESFAGSFDFKLSKSNSIKICLWRVVLVCKLTDNTVN